MKEVEPASPQKADQAAGRRFHESKGGWRRELSRKSVHLLTGLIPLSYALWFDKWTAAALLMALVLLMAWLEWIRRCKTPLGDFCCRRLSGMMREEERTGARLLGATPYCAASLVCVLLFPKPVAVLALLYLAVGDTAASLAGMAWGRHKVGKKSWEGFAGFWAATTLVAFVARICSAEYLLLPALVASPAAGLVELFLVKWDDNWSVPLTAGVVMMLLAG